MIGPLVLLGPQRPKPRVAEALDHHGLSGKLAVITAGWRHDETEIDALRRDVGDRLVHLPLYSWFDELSLSNPELVKRYSQRQQRIIDYKSAYRKQLDHAMAAVSAMQSQVHRDPDLYNPELTFTHQVLRALDQRALVRVEEIRKSEPEVCTPWLNPEVRARHDEARDVVANVDAVLIAGGHVGILRNRMYFYGIDDILIQALGNGCGIVAWSAGAMTLCNHIYLFYDDPPEGVGNAEVLDTGLKIVPNMCLFPHARQRLRMHDQARLARLAERLRPTAAITMETGAWIEYNEAEGWVDRSWEGTSTAICAGGRVLPASEALPTTPPSVEKRPRTVTP